MIDWARISELEEEVGAEDFTEIAALFLAEVGEALTSLPEPLTGPEARDAFHGLKGSALNLGFARMAELCAAAEADPASADVPGIRMAFAESRQALDARFPDLAA